MTTRLYTAILAAGILAGASNCSRPTTEFSTEYVPEVAAPVIVETPAPVENLTPTQCLDKLMAQDSGLYAQLKHDYGEYELTVTRGRHYTLGLRFYPHGKEQVENGWYFTEMVQQKHDEPLMITHIAKEEGKSLYTKWHVKHTPEQAGLSAALVSAVQEDYTNTDPCVLSTGNAVPIVFAEMKQQLDSELHPGYCEKKKKTYKKKCRAWKKAHK